MKLVHALLLFYMATRFFSISGMSPAYASGEVSLKKPPASLEEWYKPANKRQVWLHTMFRLRREMQAIAEYAKQIEPAANNQVVMQKWIKRLQKDYNKIADMVPESTLRLTPGQAADAYPAQWKQLTGA